MAQTERRKHKKVDATDHILEDIYQVLCDISDKLNGEEELDGRVELREPDSVVSERSSDLTQEEDPRPTFEPEQEFVCDICGKSFKTERGLKIHKRKTHGVHV